MGIAIFTVALAWLVYAAAGRMFGWGAACIGLLFFVFEPNILANGALVATDMAMACSLFAAVYAFYRYTEQPSIPGLLLCGLAAGLAVAAKHSGLIVLAILGLLAAVDVFLPRPGGPGSLSSPGAFSGRSTDFVLPRGPRDLRLRQAWPSMQRFWDLPPGR
jgi:hypothetical protein